MKGLTLADARCPGLNNYEVEFLIRGWRIYRQPYKFVWIYGMEMGC